MSEFARFKAWFKDSHGYSLPAWYGEIDGPWNSGAWAGWQARAALAPAAVVEVDIVEQLIQAIDNEQERLSAEDDYLMDSDDCIKVIREHVARLNRRAIPVGLLERIANNPDANSFIGAELTELRALLGKS